MIAGNVTVPRLPKQHPASASAVQAAVVNGEAKMRVSMVEVRLRQYKDEVDGVVLGDKHPKLLINCTLAVTSSASGHPTSKSNGNAVRFRTEGEQRGI